MPLPPQFEGRVFSRQDALRAGMTDRVLRGPRCVCLVPGWYCYADAEPADRLFAQAAVRWLGPGSGISHVSNLARRGLDLRSLEPLHVATRRRVDRSVAGLTVHRFLGPLWIEEVDGVPMVGAARTFVDCATILSRDELVIAGDWMVDRGLTTLADLTAFVDAVHFDGVQRARQAVELVREGAQSPQETRVRLLLVAAGLPEPEPNVAVVDDLGQFIARGDLVYRRRRVIVEYDGWHHERDARQRQHDLRRRERLEEDGWRVIVVTARDLGQPNLVAGRVRQALLQSRFA